MNKILLLKLTTILLLIAATASAQRHKRRDVDSLSVYREFVSLGKWYLKMPLQIKLHFISKTTPSARQQDNEEADMLLYYGKDDFYLQANHMEQIVNDSFTVLVNNEAKIIKLYANTRTLEEYMENIVPAYVPDSSLQQLSRRYSIQVQEGEKGLKQMLVQSRANVSGTSFPKESITISYEPGSQQPVDYFTAKRSLVLVDSAIYRQMEADPLYAGRLVTSKATNGDLFFVMKEKTTTCRFVEVSHQKQSPPALQEDRIMKNENGEYMPAKGFEAYLVERGD